MTRIDQGNWSIIHDQLHNNTGYNQAVSINLNIPTDKIIVTLNNLTSNTNWVRAGYIEQNWNRMLTEVLLTKKYLALSTPTLIYLEPVANSILRIKTVDWVKEVGIVIEAFTP